MQAGRLRKRVQIQERQTTRDGMGGVVETWVTVDTVWGDVRMSSGREQFVAEANREQAVTTHQVRMRAGNVTLTPLHRLVVGGAVLDIETVGDREGLSREIVAMCRENFGGQ